jgi:hypothetical protein
MKRCLVLLALAGALAAPARPARAQLVTSFAFTTVDSVAIQNGRFIVKGVVQGDAAASEHFFNFGSSLVVNSDGTIDACNRMALMAMSKPGQYLFEMTASSGFNVPLCRLTRLNL